MPPKSNVLAAKPTLAFAQRGSGRDVVLIHGAMTTLDDMVIALLPSLKPDFRVTAFDRPGHGRNPAPAGGTPWRQAAEVHASVEALGLERPVVVGHSFGGAVALAYALRYPDDTAGVVALAPIAFPELRLEQILLGPRALPGPLGFLHHSLGRAVDPLLLPILWRAMFLPQAMPDGFARDFPFGLAGRSDQVLSDSQDAALLAQSSAWNAMGYASCQAPVHVMAGDRDAVINPQFHARRLARWLPRGRFTNLPGLGHMVHHFAQAEIVEAIRGLLEPASRPAARALEPALLEQPA